MMKRKQVLCMHFRFRKKQSLVCLIAVVLAVAMLLLPANAFSPNSGMSAQEAARATADIAARKGRARTHGDASLGTPDPGAVSFAMLMGKVPEII